MDITNLLTLLNTHFRFEPFHLARLRRGPNPLLQKLIGKAKAPRSSNRVMNTHTRRHGMDVFCIRDQLSQTCTDDGDNRIDRGRRLEPLALFLSIAPTYPQSQIMFPRPASARAQPLRQNFSAYRFVEEEGSQWLSCQWRYPRPFAVTEIACDGVECPADFVRGMGLEKWISGNPAKVTLMSELRAWDDVDCVFVRLMEFPLVFGVREESAPTKLQVPRVSCPSFRPDTDNNYEADSEGARVDKGGNAEPSEAVPNQEFAADVWEIRLAIPGHGAKGTDTDDSPSQELPHGAQCAINLANFLMAAMTLTVKHDACHAVDMAKVQVQQMDLRIMLPSALGHHGGGDDWAEDALRLRCTDFNMQPARWSCNLSSPLSSDERVPASTCLAKRKPAKLLRCDMHVQVSADSQNMRYLHWFPLLEQFKLLSSLTLRPGVDGPRAVRLDVITSPCTRLNLCRTALLSLSTAVYAFMDAAKLPSIPTPVEPTPRVDAPASAEALDSVLEWARYVVVNQSGCTLWYGQTATVEKLLLPSGRSRAYSLHRDVTIDNQSHRPSSRISAGNESDSKDDMTGDSDAPELDGPTPVGMHFAFSQGKRGMALWSMPVPIDTPGLYIRRLSRGSVSFLPAVSLCVKVVTRGLQTKITLCSSHSLRNLGSVPLVHGYMGVMH